MSTKHDCGKVEVGICAAGSHLRTVARKRVPTRLEAFMRAMGLAPTEVTKVAAAVARRIGIRKISRQQLFNIRHGRAKATETTIFLIVSTLQEMTGLKVRAADVFRVEPSVPPAHPWARMRGGARVGELWRLSIFSPLRFERTVQAMPESYLPLEAASLRLERLYHEHAPLLRTTAKLRHRIPPEDVDELVHDVFTSWLERQPKVMDMRAYLLGATNNACLHYWRKRARETPLLEEHERTSDDSTAKQVDRWLTELSLGAMLAQLGPKCRQTLRRYYLDHQTPEVIAGEMGTTKPYVFQLLHSCRKRARDIYRRLTEPVR